MLLFVIILCVCRIFGMDDTELKDAIANYVPTIAKTVEDAAIEMKASKFMPRLLSFVDAAEEKSDILRTINSAHAALELKRPQTLEDVMLQIPSAKERRTIMRCKKYTVDSKRKLMESLPEYHLFLNDLAEKYSQFKMNFHVFDFKNIMAHIHFTPFGQLLDVSMVASHMLGVAASNKKISIQAGTSAKNKKLEIAMLEKMIMSITDELSEEEALDLLGLVVELCHVISEELDENDPQYTVLITLKQNALFELDDEILGAKRVQKFWKTTVRAIKDGCMSGTFWDGSNLLKQNLWTTGFGENGEKIYVNPITEAIEASCEQFSKFMDLTAIMLNRYGDAKINSELDQYTLRQERIYNRQLCEKWTFLCNKFSKNVLTQLGKMIVDDETNDVNDELEKNI